MALRSSTTSSSAKSLLLWLILLIAAGAFAWSFVNYHQAQRKLAILTNPKLASELSKKQTDELLSKVGKVITLPKDKSPIVATINDAETLATGQDFYRDAHNGDKLIIFQASKKAIIFDEKTGQVVNVGPIFYNSAAAEQTATKPVDRLSIEVRNGTTNADAGSATRDKLAANYAFNIVKLAKAAKNTYTQTVIVDLTGGTKSALITDLQKALNATVVTEMPEGEAPTSAEVVAIVGAK